MKMWSGWGATWGSEAEADDAVGAQHELRQEDLQATHIK